MPWCDMYEIVGVICLGPVDSVSVKRRICVYKEDGWVKLFAKDLVCKRPYPKGKLRSDLAKELGITPSNVKFSPVIDKYYKG